MQVVDSELTVSEIFDALPGGFFIYYADEDEKIIYANKGVQRIFRCESLEEFKELTHNSFKGIVHPDDLFLVEESISQQIYTDISDMRNQDYVEYRIIRKDGTIRWVEDFGHLVRHKRLAAYWLN